MNLFTTAQARALDALIIERTPIPGYQLMCQAGRACFEALIARWPHARSVAVLCGRGNNGGDGYVLARLLLGAQRKVRVHELGGGASGGAALEAKQEYLDAGGETSAPEPAAASADVVVDALFGTGLSRPPDEEALQWIDAMNATAAPTFAIDVPSGLDADTGAVRLRAVRANATITFIVRKRGLYTAAGRDCCGEIVFDDLGADPALAAEIEPAAQLAGLHDLPHWLSPRASGAHKGDFGHVLVVGGGPGMAGAARLAGEAALRAGAGRVSVAAAQDNVAAVVAGCPALMVHGIDGNVLDVLLKRAGVIAIGPGLGRDGRARTWLAKVLQSPRPKVLDADALNLLAEDSARSDRWVLTPHPGEAAKLLGTDVSAVEDDRFAAAEEIASRFGGVCLLKGAGTVVHSADNVLVCAGGNPGMATAGMGDVLTGVVAALLAQGLSLRRAAELGACVHAEAGDRAAAAMPRGLIASDLMPYVRECVN